MSGGNRAERRRVRDPSADLTAAVEHLSAGRHDKAEALCRKVLQKMPDEPNALHVLGVLALERGNPDRAIQLIGRALARAPGLVSAHGNLANAYRAAQRLPEAGDHFRRAIALQPDSAPVHTNYGLYLYETGDLVGALAHCQRAAELDPRNADVLNNLGNVYRAHGKVDMAATALRKAVALRPERADLQVNLGNLLLDLRRAEDATSVYRRAIQLRPNLAGAHYGLGLSLRLAGDAEGEIQSYRAAIALAPDQALYWNDLGRAFRALGRFEDAGDAFRKVLAIDPDFADAHRNLVSLQQRGGADADIARLAALASQPSLPVEQRVAAGFALGKVLDDADRFDDAFSAYAEANAVYRAARAALGDRFDAEALRRVVDDTIAAFTPDFFSAVAGWGNPSEVPVFIVGMPRSGTSLVEQVAASHSQVFGAGELRYIGEAEAMLGADSANWQRADVNRVADAHLERLQTLSDGASRIIDKLPDNVFKLGLIATLFPSARVIFCHRDPRDIGLSCFFQKFAPGQLTFSYDLLDCGQRYLETARLIEHWRPVLPLRMLEVDYEALIANQEQESRRLIAFLGLDWEPACLDFHLTQRTVMTASSWQVRQPLYDRSAGRWRHYAAHLRPLIDVLEIGATTSPVAGGGNDSTDRVEGER